MGKYDAVMHYIDLSINIPALHWEDQLRAGTHRVSKPLSLKMAEACLQDILQLDGLPISEKSIYYLIQSREADQYRVGVDLEKLIRVVGERMDAFTKQYEKLAAVADLLNRTHAPDNEHQGWRMDMQQQRVFFKDSSRTNFHGLKEGWQVLLARWRKFAKDFTGMTEAGLSPALVQRCKASLTIEDHARYSFGYFTDPSVIDDLYRAWQAREQAFTQAESERGWQPEKRRKHG